MHSAFCLAPLHASVGLYESYEVSESYEVFMSNAGSCESL